MYLILVPIAGAAEEPPDYMETAPRFISPEISAGDSVYVTDEGKAALAWEMEGVKPRENEVAVEFELQEAPTAKFENPEVRYQGPDAATYVSGLPEGDFFYRVRAIQDGLTGPWSKPITVRVKYVRFDLVLTLLASGAVVFVATVLTVSLGHRRIAREQAE